jgi:3D-(3,5/4)-trihydroxycyclohexane-1,2-dione acylhydrolase (decyclizing)
VQAEAFDWPETFFAERRWTVRRPRPDANELDAATRLLRDAQRPLIVAGGGIHYAEAHGALARLAEGYGCPVAETQAGKSSLPHAHALNLGAIGVTGTGAANAMAEEADVVLAVGTRLQDFTTGSRTLFRGRIIGLNVQPFDAEKHGAVPLVADAREGLDALISALAGHRAAPDWTRRAQQARDAWIATAATYTAPTDARPSDAQVIGAVQRASDAHTIIVGAAGGLPGELHKLWQAGEPGSYHLEYGYSCMGYEIAGGLGVKMARPDAHVVVMVGDGSYLMMNSEVATSVAMGRPLTIVLVDNHGFGCINRLQAATGGAPFNNLLPDAHPPVDFRAHAESLGAIAERVATLRDLEDAVRRARTADRTTVIVVETDPALSTDAGGHWWDVGVPKISDRQPVRDARARYEAARMKQTLA